MKLRHVKFFGVRYALNLIIDWVNAHEVQSQETLVAREKTRSYLQDHEDGIGDLLDKCKRLEGAIAGLVKRIEQLEPKDNPNKFTG